VRQLQPSGTVAIVGAGPVGLAALMTDCFYSPAELITHRFELDDVMKAYDTFGNASREQALKVLMTGKGQ
jgi:threonine dehydrogenase-like Zn-dependent dehydrogenase